jgi:hypothetical protein
VAVKAKAEVLWASAAKTQMMLAVWIIYFSLEWQSIQYILGFADIPGCSKGLGRSGGELCSGKLS